jgi:trans-2,3-dihydro-3-hydroxyanthranilate isomerase
LVRLPFYIVDVFGETKYSGNQLAVVRHGKALSGPKMQKIARETNFSETTFILSDEKKRGGYDVRIFTPGTELPFAGHPTLGTAYVILKEIQGGKGREIVLNLKVGQIPVSIVYKGKGVDVLWMKQKTPVFGKTIDRASLALALGLLEDEIDDAFLPEEVSTGLFAIMAPLKSIDAVKRCRVVQDRYLDLIRDIPSKGILVFCKETQNPDNDIHARFFGDYLGVPEDPATGSANGCLAAYLVKHRYFGKSKVDVRVEQGYEIGRPALLLLRAKERQGKIEVRVGGKAIMTARGELL